MEKFKLKSFSYAAIFTLIFQLLVLFTCIAPSIMFGGWSIIFWSVGILYSLIRRRLCNDRFVRWSAPVIIINVICFLIITSFAESKYMLQHVVAPIFLSLLACESIFLISEALKARSARCKANTCEMTNKSRANKVLTAITLGLFFNIILIAAFLIVIYYDRSPILRGMISLLIYPSAFALFSCLYFYIKDGVNGGWDYALSFLLVNMVLGVPHYFVVKYVCEKYLDYHYGSSPTSNQMIPVFAVIVFAVDVIIILSERKSKKEVEQLN